MNCLINRIGIRGCDAPSTQAVTASLPGVLPVVVGVEALPVLFINDLPGISAENIAAITGDEEETYLALWNTIVLRTMKKFEILVKAKLNQCFRLTDKTVVECLICEKKDLFDVALWYLHGTELMIERTSSDETNRFTTIDFEKAERLKEEFYAEFQGALTDAVKSIDPKDSDCIDGCVECVESVKWVMKLSL